MGYRLPGHIYGGSGEHTPDEARLVLLLQGGGRWSAGASGGRVRYHRMDFRELSGPSHRDKSSRSRSARYGRDDGLDGKRLQGERYRGTPAERRIGKANES